MHSLAVNLEGSCGLFTGHISTLCHMWKKCCRKQSHADMTSFAGLEKLQSCAEGDAAVSAFSTTVP